MPVFVHDIIMRTSFLIFFKIIILRVILFSIKLKLRNNEFLLYFLHILKDGRGRFRRFEPAKCRLCAVMLNGSQRRHLLFNNRCICLLVFHGPTIPGSHTAKWLWAKGDTPIPVLLHLPYQELQSELANFSDHDKLSNEVLTERAEHA